MGLWQVHATRGQAKIQQQRRRANNIRTPILAESLRGWWLALQYVTRLSRLDRGKNSTVIPSQSLPSPVPLGTQKKKLRERAADRAIQRRMKRLDKDDVVNRTNTVIIGLFSRQRVTNLLSPFCRRCFRSPRCLVGSTCIIDHRRLSTIIRQTHNLSSIRVTTPYSFPPIRFKETISI